MGVLGHEPDLGKARPSWRAARSRWRAAAPRTRRGPRASCFAGLEMVEPGLVPITRWRADGAPVDADGAVARATASRGRDGCAERGVT
ncbi:hypothetical protein GCM10009678_78110 [Actinomadura kijaniata]